MIFSCYGNTHPSCRHSNVVCPKLCAVSRLKTYIAIHSVLALGLFLAQRWKWLFVNRLANPVDVQKRLEGKINKCDAPVIKSGDSEEVGKFIWSRFRPKIEKISGGNIWSCVNPRAYYFSSLGTYLAVKCCRIDVNVFVLMIFYCFVCFCLKRSGKAEEKAKKKGVRGRYWRLLQRNYCSKGEKEIFIQSRGTTRPSYLQKLHRNECLLFE